MSSSRVSVRELSFGSPEQRATIALRDEVLRRPLGLVFSAEELAAENGELHFAAYYGETLVGCLLLRPLELGRIKMRQVAVASAWTGRGVGRALVEYAESAASERRFSVMELNARETAVPFYLALAYRIVGERFVEVTLPHFKMEKRLTR